MSLSAAIKLVKPKKRIKKFSIAWFLLYTFMLILVLFTSLPLIYMVSHAFKPYDELMLFPPRFLVRKPTINNFIELLTAVNSSVVPFTRYIFNSVFTTVMTVLGTVLICSMGAYALAKFKLPGANWIFMVVISALMFSPHVTQIPTYMVITKLGMFNTYWALIIPKLAVAYNFFLMKQFCEQIPNDLIESGRIDGAGEFKIFWRLIMPNLKPAWSTLIVFSFISNWNDYFSALVYTSSQAMRTLPLALDLISTGSIARSGAGAAATFLTVTPTIILFMCMRGMVMQTMTHSGIKG